MLELDVSGRCDYAEILIPHRKLASPTNPIKSGVSSDLFHLKPVKFCLFVNQDQPKGRRPHSLTLLKCSGGTAGETCGAVREAEAAGQAPSLSPFATTSQPSDTLQRERTRDVRQEELREKSPGSAAFSSERRDDSGRRKLAGGAAAVDELRVTFDLGGSQQNQLATLAPDQTAICAWKRGLLSN